MKQAQEKLLMLENENEDLRKQVVAGDRRLKDLQLQNEDQHKHIITLEEKLKNMEFDMTRMDEKKNGKKLLHPRQYFTTDYLFREIQFIINLFFIHLFLQSTQALQQKALPILSVL